MQFIDSIAIDDDHSDGTIASSAGLIGYAAILSIPFQISLQRRGIPKIANFLYNFSIFSDLCDAYGNNEMQSLVTGNVQGMLQEGLKSKESKTSKVCAWALKELHKVK